MSTGRRIISLRWKLAGAFALLMVALSVALLLFLPPQLEKSANKWARERGLDIASVLGVSVKTTLDLGVGDTKVDISNKLATLASAEGSVYGALFLEDGAPMGGWHPERAPQDHTLDAAGKDRVVFGDNRLDVFVPVRYLDAQASERTATLAVGFSLERLARDKRENLITVMLIALGISVIGILIAVLAGTFLVRPISGLTELTGRMVNTADLGLRIAMESNDEVGLLADSFGALVEWLRNVAKTMNGLVVNVSEVIVQLSQAGAVVTTGASTLRKQVEDTSASITDMQASLRDVAASIDVLKQDATDGSTSIMQLTAANDEIAKKTRVMTERVQGTTGAVQRMIASFNEIAKNIEQLNATITETSTSMMEIDASISEVEQKAGETAQLSALVSENAETGVKALQKTLNGIAAISDSTTTAADVIRQLVKSIAEIGNALTVIDEVAQKTNLLALNASIIATQAGEHGAGFSVVASEIKGLANRTRASTTEIAGLIATIQQESQRAIEAMDKGLEAVNEGKRLGRETADALAKILESSVQAKTMGRAIARATEQQAGATKQVNRAIQRIAQSVQDLSKLSTDQARGSQEIRESTNKMTTLTDDVLRSSDEQAGGSKQVTASIASIRRMIDQVSEAQLRQTLGSETFVKAIASIQSVAGHQDDSARNLKQAIDALQRQADEMRRVMSRFHGLAA